MKADSACGMWHNHLLSGIFGISKGGLQRTFAPKQKRYDLSFRQMIDRTRDDAHEGS